MRENNHYITICSQCLSLVGRGFKTLSSNWNELHFSGTNCQCCLPKTSGNVKIGFLNTLIKVTGLKPMEFLWKGSDFAHVCCEIQAKYCLDLKLRLKFQATAVRSCIVAVYCYPGPLELSTALRNFTVPGEGP